MKVKFNDDFQEIPKGTMGSLLGEGYSFSKDQKFYLVQILKNTRLENVIVFEEDFNKLDLLKDIGN